MAVGQLDGFSPSTRRQAYLPNLKGLVGLSSQLHYLYVHKTYSFIIGTKQSSKINCSVCERETPGAHKCDNFIHVTCALPLSRVGDSVERYGTTVWTCATYAGKKDH